MTTIKIGKIYLQESHEWYDEYELKITRVVLTLGSFNLDEEASHESR